MSRTKKLLFLVNSADFFLSHRLPIALAAREQGYDVHVATAPNTGEQRVVELGLPFHSVPLTRQKSSLWQELHAFMSICRLYWQIRPDIVHHVTIKPLIYGSLAARITRVPGVVNAVSGLGYLFTSQGRMSPALRWVLCRLLRLAFGHSNSRVIFQNPDDQRELTELGVVRPEQVVLIKGSGVDLNKFFPNPEPVGTPVVMLAARMLWDKGVGEFVAAASQLKSNGVNARFVLVGAPDPGNPTSVPEQQLQQWHQQGIIEWWGGRENMSKVLSQAHVICLPSYREGLPKVLVEAAASGRAIVATDVPGCREIARHQKNALLVPIGAIEPLALTMATLIADSELRQTFGANGRAMAEKEFSQEHVTAQVMGLYCNLSHG